MMWRQLRNSDNDNHDNDDDNNNNNNDNNNHHHNFKNFSLHERVRLQLKECLDSGFVPSWLTKRRTSLLQKDKSKGNVASIYRPISCFAINVEVIGRCNYRSDIYTFRSIEVVTRKAERVQERF